MHSKYKGVTYCKKNKNWRSTLYYKNIQYECGRHATERDAAKARDMKIINLGINKPLQILKRV